MEDKLTHLRFHHKGKFLNNAYVGGQQTDAMGVDLNLLSYSVLMEHVKDDRKYTEIGGIYSSKGKKGGWKLVVNDADLFELVKGVSNGGYIELYVDNMVDNKIEPAEQMQPHVIVRPRQNLLAATTKKQEAHGSLHSKEVSTAK